MTDLFGLALAPVSRSVPQATSVAAQMSGTYGLRGSVSSASATLQQSLANRLQERLDSLGSTMFTLTWKSVHTPLRRQICALRASAPRISGYDCTSWPTPTINPASNQITHEAAEKEMVRRGPTNNLGVAAHLASWPTPVKEDARSSARHGYMITGNQGTTMLDAARLTGWSTPRAEDAESAGMRHSRGVADTLTAQSRLSSWATPSARDHKDSSDPATWNCTEQRDRYDQLPRQAQLSHWQTPATDSFRSRGGDRKNEMGLDQQARTALLPTASGPTPSGSPAATASGGQLNPALPRWLQGYPTGWDACAVTVTRSVRRSPPNSSAPRSTPSDSSP